MFTPSLTFEHLSKSYPAVITQEQLAEIFGFHVQTIRKMTREGSLQFRNVSFTPAEKRYLLEEVAHYLQNPPTTPKKRRGRPVGSKNKTQ